MTLRPSTTQTLGWQGLTAEVPSDWSVGAATGDEHEGYLRVDGPDFPRLEVRWSDAGKADLDKTVAGYLKDLQRAKRKTPVEVDAETRFISRRKLGKDQIRPFVWRSETVSYGVGWICKKCNRLVLAQVLGHREEAGLEALAVEVLSHLEDHGRDGWKVWSLYDLYTEAPEDFTVSKSNFRAGLTELNFTRAAERIVVARWGMAETALRGTTLSGWARVQLYAPLRSYAPKMEELSFRDHETLRLTGEAGAPLGMALRVGRHLAQKVHADQLLGYIWHCPETNRLYVVYGIVDVNNRELVDQVRDRTKCHE
jgi:hypothetical protein